MRTVQYCYKFYWKAKHMHNFSLLIKFYTRLNDLLKPKFCGTEIIKMGSFENYCQKSKKIQWKKIYIFSSIVNSSSYFDDIGNYCNIEVTRRESLWILRQTAPVAKCLNILLQKRLLAKFLLKRNPSSSHFIKKVQRLTWGSLAYSTLSPQLIAALRGLAEEYAAKFERSECGAFLVLESVF